MALQWSAWEKQQKEIAKHQDIIQRLAGGAQSGRAAWGAGTWLASSAWRGGRFCHGWGSGGVEEAGAPRGVGRPRRRHRSTTSAQK